MISRRLLVLLPLLLVPCSLAQFQHLQKNGSVRVRIVFPDGSPCHVHAHVLLVAKTTTGLAGETLTGDDCRAEFGTLLAGIYYVEVSGEGIESAESAAFEVGATTQLVYVTVKPAAEVLVRKGSPSSMVALVDLKIPGKARKEFDQASALIAKDNWTKALEHLQKAVALYPQYAAAYNNLGVAYAHLGDVQHEREALQKAMSLNDHFAPTLTNLARLAIVDRDLPEAEAILNRVTAIDPDNVQTLVLLAKIELLNHHFEAAVTNCRKVHTLHHGSQPVVHYIAARALEGEDRPADAVAELHTFLDEQPSGPGADLARKEMAVLENQVQLSAAQR